jgi:hypothetical protein
MTTIFATTGADLTSTDTRRLFDAIVNALTEHKLDAAVVLDSLGPESYVGTYPQRVSAVVLERGEDEHDPRVDGAIRHGVADVLGADVPVDVIVTEHDLASFAVDGVLGQDR